MNKEQTQAAIAVMQAFVDGKTIEFCNNTKAREPLWQEISKFNGIAQPVWNWLETEYRAKRETLKYRRFIVHHEGSPPVVCTVGSDEVASRYHEGVCGFVRWIDTEWQEEIV